MHCTLVRRRLTREKLLQSYSMGVLDRLFALQRCLRRHLAELLSLWKEVP